MTDFGQAKAKILIVDDDVDLALNLHDILEKESYTTEIIHDGQTAMAACREKTFDLVISDMKLPDISGVELIDRLAELLPEIEAIIITANATLDTAIEAVGQKHIIDYQTKPLDMDSFLKLVRQVIDDKQSREKQKNRDNRFRQQLDYILSLEHDDKEYSLDDLINLEDMQRTIISLKETESELQTKNEGLIAAGSRQQSLLHALEEQNKLDRKSVV